MKTTVVLILLAATLVASPVATASEQLNCSGTPTDTDLGDWAYQTTCAAADLACEFVFDPCPLEPRVVD